MAYSPAFSTVSDMTDEELDMYFASYVPLSNLPTPPPVKEPILHASSQPADAQDAKAVHLANLVPPNACAHHRPYAPAIAGFLHRANLSDPVVAFSACLLDSLSSRFAASWQHALAPQDASRQHVAVSPDVIVLAALSLAHGWLTDGLRGVQHWSLRESGGLFSAQEIEATKRAILVDMDYGLLRISEKMVQKRLNDMRHPTPVACDPAGPAVKAVNTSRSRKRSRSLVGTTLWRHGVQTPEPSP